MCVAESCASVRMTELLLGYFDGIASIHDERGDGMTERMELAPPDSQRIEDRPELIFHAFVSGGGPPVSLAKQEALGIRFPVRLVLGQDHRQCRGQRDRHCTSIALCGLRLAVPRGAADVNALV